MTYRLVFYKDDTILGRIIKFFTRGQYCHVGILINGTTIFDANFGRKSRLSYFEYNGETQDIYRINGVVNDTLATHFIYSHLNKSYDLSEIFKILFNLKHIPDDDDKFICSTLVKEFIEQCTDLKIDSKVYIMSPQDLVDTGLLTEE